MTPTGGNDDETGFAGRWSRLKQDARNPKQSLEKEPDVAPPATADEAPDERTDEEILEALGLPDPDSLKPGDDFSAFMAKTVPAKLRSRALRKLWISNPVLANLDELVEYGEDYTDAATVIENLATGYQVGKGWASKIIETPKPLTARAEEDAAEPEPGGDSELEPGAAEAGPEVDQNPEETPPETAENETAPEAIAGASISPQAPVAPQQFSTRRRMRFRVTED